MKLAVGQRARRSITFTREHVRTSASLTGDDNPLHLEGDFSSKTRFGRLVVQGGLTTGLPHALVAMDMPGPGTVFLSLEWKFTAPVHNGGLPAVLIAVCMVWGFAVVADSAQFSAAVSEMCEREHTGHHPPCSEPGLPADTADDSPGADPDRIGRLAPGFAFLAIGPVVGIWAMAALRRLQEASKLAGGKG